MTVRKRSASMAVSRSQMPRWISTREPAEQVWPPFWTMALTITGAAASRSASSKTICGDLPPSSSVQGMWFRAAAIWTCSPTSGEPVKLMKSTPGCSESARPATSPRPVTILMAPGGKPVSVASSPMRNMVRQASSAGLVTVALPMASAAPTERPKICTG